MTTTEKAVLILVNSQEPTLDLVSRSLGMGDGEANAETIRSAILPMLAYAREGWRTILSIYGPRVNPSIKSAVAYIQATYARIRDLISNRKIKTATMLLEQRRERLAALIYAANTDSGFDPSQHNPFGLTD